MKSKAPLDNVAVLVTRPGSKGTALVEQLNELGAEAYAANMLEIELRGESAEMQTVLTSISCSTILVFVSVHAVNAFKQALDLSGQVLPASVRVAAVGGATARALEMLGLKVVFTPEEQMNSEGLIAAFEDTLLSNQKVILVRGQTGRTLISDTFRDRGADVIEVEAYVRRYLRPDLAPMLSSFTPDKHRLIIVTSVELLDELNRCVVNEDQRDRLFSCDLVVLSQRIAEAAQNSGFTGQVYIAPETSSAGLLKAALSLGSKSRND